MALLTEHEAGVLDAVGLGVVDVLHPVGNHEHVRPADVGAAPLQLAHQAYIIVLEKVPSEGS